MSNNSVGSIAEIRKKAYEIHELISTSYHESGHTIYGLLHCMKIEPVYVFEEKKSKRIGGLTHYDSPSLDKIEDPTLLFNRIKAEIGLSYAGLAAEKHHFKITSGSDKFPLFLREGSYHDTLSASQLIQKYCLTPTGKKRYAYKKKIIKEVTQELCEHWDAVTIVAHALFQKKKLYFSDLKTLLTRKSKNKEFWKNKFKLINSFYDKDLLLDEKKLKYILSL